MSASERQRHEQSEQTKTTNAPKANVALAHRQRSHRPRAGAGRLVAVRAQPGAEWKCTASQPFIHQRFPLAGLLSDRAGYGVLWASRRLAGQPGWWAPLATHRAAKRRRDGVGRVRRQSTSQYAAGHDVFLKSTDS